MSRCQQFVGRDLGRVATMDVGVKHNLNSLFELADGDVSIKQKWQCETALGLTKIMTINHISWQKKHISQCMHFINNSMLNTCHLI